MWNDCQAWGTNLPFVRFSLDSAIPQGVYDPVGTSSRIAGGLSGITPGAGLLPGKLPGA